MSTVHQSYKVGCDFSLRSSIWLTQHIITKLVSILFSLIVLGVTNVHAALSVPSESNTGNYTISGVEGMLYERVDGGSWVWQGGYYNTATSISYNNKPIGVYEYRILTGNFVPNESIRVCQSEGGLWFSSPRGCLLSGTYSTPMAITVVSTPGIPSSISVPSTSASGAFTVSWGTSTETVHRYRLFQQANAGSWVEIYSGLMTSIAVSGLADGSYVFRVQACNTLNGTEDCSNYRTSNTTLVANTPGIPSSITAPSTDNDGAFTVSWGTSTGSVDRYELYQQANGSTWSLIYSGLLTSKAVNGLADGNYTYQVRACNTQDTHTTCSGYRTSTASIVANTPGVPVDISGVPATDSEGAFTVSWGASPGAVDAYELYQQANGGAWSLVYSGSLASKAISGLTDGSYAYRVRACNTEGTFTTCSGYTTLGTSTVANAPGIPPSISVPATNDNGAFTISWSASTGNVDHYELYQQNNAGTWSKIYTGVGTSHGVTGLGNGKYAFRVRACNIESSFTACSGYRVSSVSSVYTGGLESIGFDPANDAMPESEYYGQLTGTHAVEKNGSFSYRIPIDVAPGINGMQPKLALVYNSNHKNGLVGWGWTLVGISSIHRCPASLARDNEISGVLYGDNFKFCLDGQRLIEIAPGEYRTETESYSKIVSEGVAGSGPATWTVYGKDGRVYQYGHTATSVRVERTRADIYAWHLNKVTDVAGNYLDTFYENEATASVAAGTHRPERIEYTKNDLSQGTNQEVIFHYENRPDKTEKYFGGILSKNDKRLSRIEIKSNTATVRYYDLTYQNYGHAYFGKPFKDPVKTSRLTKVTLCASAGVCAEPIEFDWTSAALGQFTIDTSTTITPDVEEASNQLRGDFDGDGQQEVVYLGLDNKYYLRQHDEVESGSNAMWYDCNVNDCSKWSWKDYRNVALDMNGDGKDDIITSESSQYGAYVAVSTGSSFLAPVAWGAYSPEPSFPNLDEQSVIIDVNGDTLPDVLLYRVTTQTVYVRLNNGSTFGAREIWYQGNGLADLTSHVTMDNQNVWSLLQFADFNGDGLVDIWGRDFFGDYKAYISVALNQGNSFASPVRWHSAAIFMDDKKFGDINGDGLLDYLEMNVDGNVYVRLSDGTQFLPAENWTQAEQIYGCARVDTNYDVSPYRQYCGLAGGLKYNNQFTHKEATVLADMNGDGCADIVSTGGSYNTIFDHAVGIFVSLSRCAYNDAEQMGFTPVMQWSSQAAPGLWYTAPPGIPYSHPYLRPGDGNQEPLMNVDGKNLPDMRFGSTRLESPRIVAIKAGLGGQFQLGVTYESIVEPTVHEMLAGEENSDFFNAIREKNLVGFDIRSTYASKSAIPLHVVSELNQSDGVGGNNLVSYFYSGYKRHKLGYGELGFASVEKTEQINGLAGIRRTVSDYNQVFNANYLLVGSSSRTQVYATDKNRTGGVVLQLLSDTKYRWKIRIYNDDIDIGHTSPHYFPYLYQSTTERWDLNGAKIADSVTSNFDNFSACIPIGQPQILTTNAGDAIDDADYHADGVLLYSETVTCDTSGSANAKQLNAVKNSNITSLATPWVRGLVGRVEQQANTGLNLTDASLLTRTTAYTFTSKGQVLTKTIEPDAAANSPLKHTTTYSYNNYGSVSNQEETWDSFTDDGLNFITRSTHINETYDAQGVRTVTITNPLNHTQTTKYNAQFGLPFEVSDVSQLITTTSYDSLGRIDAIVYPDTTRTNYDYRTCSNACFADSQFESYYIQVKTTGKSATRTYFDTFEREVGTRVRNLTGEFVYTARTYDGQGNLASQIDPFKINGIQYSTAYSYDILNRNTSTVFADNTEQTVNYNGLTHTTTNRIQQTQTRHLNGASWVMKSTDNANVSVDFTYWPFGDLKTTAVNDDAKTLVSISYDALGRKIQLNDPNIGVTNYTYNPLGLLATSTDARGQVTRYVYDKLGRQISRVDDATSAGAASRTHSWIYDNKLNGKGALGTLSGFNTDGSAFREEYTYNALSLLEKTTTTIGTSSYTFTQHYDNFSRNIATTYPTGYAIANRYNLFGYVGNINNLSNGKLLWTANATNARGQVTQFALGNGVLTDQAFDGPTGRIDTIHAYKGAFDIQKHNYDFDPLGNLIQRQDDKNIVTQSFCYDAMNRLKAARFDGCTSATEDFTYDVLGNIQTKVGVVGNYLYGQNGAGPNAVTSANGLDYQYDLNGNLTTVTNGATTEKTVTYSVFNKPTRMSNGAGWSEVVYGPHKRRVKRTDSDGRTTTYVALGVYEETSVNGTTEKVHYIGNFALYVEQSGALNGQFYRYVHRDHIGSLIAKSGESAIDASDVEFLANGAWGERLRTTWDGLGEGLGYQPSVTARGFTSHEHLDSVGLIHMNGRVYDPELGRFLSPDPLVQAPDNTQSYNRYSYVFNNPLSGVDPSGFASFLQEEANDILEEVEATGEKVEDFESLHIFFSQIRESQYTWIQVGDFLFNTDYFSPANPEVALATAYANSNVPNTGVGSLPSAGVVGVGEQGYSGGVGGQKGKGRFPSVGDGKDDSDLKFTTGFQGGARIGLTKLLGAKVDLDLISREVSLITGKEYANQSFALSIDVVGFSFGFDASRNVEFQSFIYGQDSLSSILSGTDFQFKPVFSTPWSVSAKEFWKIDIGASAIFGIEGTLDLAE